jgi:hypothetical protein
MKLSQNFLKHAGMVAVLFGASAGCGDAQVLSACAEGDMVGGALGVCAGLAEAAVCGVDTCTEGISCVTTIKVRDDAELQAALADASAGTCIALAPGSYGSASLPGGVSLLGKSAADVAIEGVTLGAGKGAVVRGLTVRTGGLRIQGATEAQITSLLVVDSAGEGIEIGPGSSAKIAASTVRGSARYGIKVADGADVALDTSIVEASQGPGIWAACSSECAACAAPPKVAVTSSIVRDNHIGGIALFTTWANLKNVDIRRTAPGDQWHPDTGGGGLSAVSCSNVVATALRVHDSASYGVLIDGSSVNMSSESAPDGDIDIRRNLMGVWVQNVAEPQSVVLTRALIDGNGAVGVGVSGQTGAFIFRRSSIRNTSLQAVPAESAGAQIGSTSVGDGFVWRDGSSVMMDSLTFSNNARASVLINGPAEGSISNVTLSGGDEQKGIAVQNVSNKDAKPTVSEGTPALRTSKGEAFAIPIAPQRLERDL